MTSPMVDALRARRKELQEQLRHAAYFPERAWQRANLVDLLHAVEQQLSELAGDSSRRGQGNSGDESKGLLTG